MKTFSFPIKKCYLCQHKQLKQNRYMNPHSTFKRKRRRFAFVALALLLLPSMLFAKGEVIGYAAGWTSAPTAAQLDRVTHVMVFQLFPNTTGGLLTTYVPSWLNSFVKSAHAKNVMVSITLGGASDNLTANFITATNDANRPTLVNNVKDFVSRYNLDGVDVDWEFPKGNTEWGQCISLLEDLKAAMPDKRISIALGGDSPNPQFNNHFSMTNKSIVQTRIWVADAIHLMTYDMMGVTRPVKWETHASVTGSIACIDAWATFGQGQPEFTKEKLVMGCAFFARQGTDGDNVATLKQKVDYCYDNGYGGVMIWELSQDLPNNTLLSAIWNANEENKAKETNDVRTAAAENRWQLYPNPVTSELYILKPFMQGTADYTVYNGLGEAVLQGILQANSIISVQSLPKGIYYLRALGEVRKIIKN